MTQDFTISMFRSIGPIPKLVWSIHPSHSAKTLSASQPPRFLQPLGIYTSTGTLHPLNGPATPPVNKFGGLRSLEILVNICWACQNASCSFACIQKATLGVTCRFRHFLSRTCAKSDLVWGWCGKYLFEFQWLTLKRFPSRLSFRWANEWSFGVDRKNIFGYNAWRLWLENEQRVNELMPEALTQKLWLTSQK